MSPKHSLAALILWLAVAHPTAAQQPARIFDDVETYPHLPFQRLSMNPISWTHTGIPAPSCLSGNRTFILYPEGSSLAFDDLQIDAFAGSNNVFFDLRMDQLPGKRLATQTTFSMNIQTNWVPHDFSTAAPSVPPGFELRAQPSVTSGPTRFRLVNPLDRDLRLQIFDVRG